MNLTYFIADAHGFVKIGKSTSPRHRLVSLQTAHAEPLTLLATVLLSEGHVHGRFAHLHERGEWFRLEPELLDWLAVHGDLKHLPPEIPYREPAIRSVEWARESLARLLAVHNPVINRRRAG